jgi:NADPH:quinone reductase-like Zn-dependent oxidoreductase
MLEQFEELSPGDAVVQNGATSAVGQVSWGSQRVSDAGRVR